MSNSLKLSPEDIKEIEIKANTKLTELHKSQRILGKEVLNIVRKEATLLLSPFDNDELCAFVCQKKGELFVYINSYLPVEKQYFAAAHELYHIWFDKEYLRNPEMLSSDTLNDGSENIRELKANLFAAMFLVPKHVLQQELLFIGAKQNAVTPVNVVELAHTFQVPYKSITLRLFEINYIDEHLLNQLVSNSHLEQIIRKRLQLEEPKLLKPIIHYEGFVDKIVNLYRENQISPKFLRENLSLLNLVPSDVGIALAEELPSEEEIDKLLEEDED